MGIGDGDRGIALFGFVDLSSFSVVIKFWSYRHVHEAIGVEKFFLNQRPVIVTFHMR